MSVPIQDNIDRKWLSLDVSAEVDDGAFLSLTVTTDWNDYLVDGVISVPADVDEFERQVIAACAAYRESLKTSGEVT